MTGKAQASSFLRALPSVDALLRTETAKRLGPTVGAERLTALARSVTEELRAEILSRETAGEAEGRGPSKESLLAEAALRLGRLLERENERGLRRVINASGVILHTNLGRAPLSEAARSAVADQAARYCTLEYDIETGSRSSRRGGRVEQLLCELTGAEESLVVNNCAAAALLILTALAQDGEVIVSRGELVEIGGDFRVPEVMAQSGARLIEVGTTNRTRLEDYRRAISERTRLLMRVHPSNYRIVGFTSAPALGELTRLAHDSGLALYEDAGSGALSDLRPYGLEDEPVIGRSIASGADLVSFSGDKLLGAAQAGLIVGRQKLIERLRKHPLYRALRADKLILAALEATLDAHRRSASFQEIPTLRMLSLTAAELKERALSFHDRLRERVEGGGRLGCEVIEGVSAVGGGAAPTTHPATALLSLSHETLSADALEEALRRSRPPVVARIADGRVLLDLRTVSSDEEAELLEVLATIQA